MGPLTFVCVFSLSNPKLTSFFVRFFLSLVYRRCCCCIKFLYCTTYLVRSPWNWQKAFIPYFSLSTDFYFFSFFLSFFLLKKKFDHFSLFVPCWTIHPCPPSSSSSSISTSYLPTQIPTQKKEKLGQTRDGQTLFWQVQDFQQMAFPCLSNGEKAFKNISLIRTIRITYVGLSLHTNDLLT